MTKIQLYVFKSLSNLGEMYLEDEMTEAGVKSGTRFHAASDVDTEIERLQERLETQKGVISNHIENERQLQGNLSLAEEGLANATQEIERLKHDVSRLTASLSAEVTHSERLRVVMIRAQRHLLDEKPIAALEVITDSLKRYAEEPTSKETIAMPWSMTRQRRYDEIAKEILAGSSLADRASPEAFKLHQEIVRRIDAECEALGLPVNTQSR